MRYSDHVHAIARIEKVATDALRSVTAHGDLLRAALVVINRHGLIDEFIAEYSYHLDSRPIPATAAEQNVASDENA